MMDSYETSEKMIAADGILKREAIGVIKTAPGTYLLRTLWNVPRMWFSAAVESRMSPVALQSTGLPSMTTGPMVGCMSPMTPCLSSATA